ncbi:MAG: flagellar basal-body rod protein FlgF [Burkholderiales bacterium]
MDRLIYVAMNGAKHAMEKQATVSNNLANASTTGFKAQLDAFRALPSYGPGAGTRTYVMDTEVGTDFSFGSIQTTGRPLDVAVNGKGWIAVQGRDGREAYTRDGNIQLSPNGVMQTRDGLNLLGEGGGPITVPPNSQVAVAPDGTVSVVPQDSTPNAVNIVGRIKLVNPPEKDLVRGGDGLFQQTNGQPAPADASVALAPASLESSNVSAVESLVSMMTHTRQFETQIKLIQTAEAMFRELGQVISMNG